MVDQDELKKKMASWGSAVSKDQPAVGVSSEMVKKAMALNPKLRQTMKTQDIVKQIANAGQGAAARAAGTPAPAAIPTDVMTEIIGARDDYKNELTRITAEEQRLAADRKAAKEKNLDRVLTAVVTIDPNMVSPRTLYVIEQEKQFLKDVGFDIGKVVERQSKPKR